MSRRTARRGPGALLPALALLLALVVASPAAAATREYWIAAVPVTWNVVPNGHNATEGETFAPEQTTIETVVYKRFTPGWKDEVRDVPWVAGDNDGIPGPLIRARVGDRILVQMPGRYFEPARLTALVGDTVTWTNSGIVIHDVRSAAGGFDSGLLAPGESFSLTLTTQGAYPYVCSIHPFMQGELDVYAIALSAPSEAVHPGESATLSGLAPAGTAEVTIVAVGADGAGVPVGVAAAGEDGSFRFTVFPSGPTEYRAVSGELESPTALVSVSAAVYLRRVRAAGRAVVLEVSTSPAQAGAPVVLERYAPERFTWVQRGSRAASTPTRRLLPIRPQAPDPSAGGARRGRGRLRPRREPARLGRAGSRLTPLASLR
jgi:plastocyanin